MQSPKGIAILGSTGKTGGQALDILSLHANMFDLQVIAANENAELLIEQAKKHQPNIVVSSDDDYEKVSQALWEEDIHVYAGKDALMQVLKGNEIYTVLSASESIDVLEPTVSAIEAGKTIALANNKTLTIAGEMIKSIALKHGARIIPVDSSLSGIFQCLAGEYQNGIERVYITSKERENHVSLMETGWRIMEAHWLFDLRPDQVDLLIHPQGVIESLIQFDDGSIKAHWAAEEEAISLQYALTYPHRVKKPGARFNFLNQPDLQFDRPNLSDFHGIQLIYDAMDAGGTVPCALYAANEVTIKKYSDGSISADRLVKVNEEVMRKMHSKGIPEPDEILETYAEARQLASELCG